MKNHFLYAVLILSLTSCYYHVEEELYPTLECQTMDVTYSNQVLSIIQSHCYQCHDAIQNFGNITLEGYEELKKYVDSGQLLGTLRHEAGFSPMPKNEPPLLDCDIEKIEAWVNAGALNN